jgi:protein required for attachment to host cells
MRIKLLLLTAMCIAVALGAAAFAATTPAPTFLTIKGPNGDFHGRIDSPKLHKCVDGRLVNVFKQKGAEQHPKTDQQIGADTAEIKGDHGVWSIGNSGFKSGRFYARAPKTSRCKTGKSKTIKIGPTLAPTTVTIEGENGDYHGTVDSPKLTACADGRLIRVYRQSGAEQAPATDDEIGMDTSELNGDHGEWSIGNSGFKTGRFYARAAKTTACKAGSSETIER